MDRSCPVCIDLDNVTMPITPTRIAAGLTKFFALTGLLATGVPLLMAVYTGNQVWWHVALWCILAFVLIATNFEPPDDFSPVVPLLLLFSAMPGLHYTMSYLTILVMAVYLLLGTMYLLYLLVCGVKAWPRYVMGNVVGKKIYVFKDEQGVHLHNLPLNPWPLNMPCLELWIGSALGESYFLKSGVRHTNWRPRLTYDQYDRLILNINPDDIGFQSVFFYKGIVEKEFMKRVSNVLDVLADYTNTEQVIRAAQQHTKREAEQRKNRDPLAYIMPGDEEP